MNNINFLKPDKSNLNTFLYTGSFLFFISVLDVFLNSFFKFNFIGFLDDNPKLKNFSLFDYPVIGNIDWLDKNTNTVVTNTVARNTSVRKIVTKKIVEKSSQCSKVWLN